MTFDRARDEQKEDEPRGSDICPECGNAHTIGVQSLRAHNLIFRICECGASWYVEGIIITRFGMKR